MSDLTRRSFVAMAGTAWTARSYAAIIGANDRLRMGVIGCGGMATAGHMRPLVREKEALNLEFNSVCDLFDKRADSASELTGAPNKFRDYRKLLDNKDVDYVLVATPEHWHAQISMDAATAGKHIYCEKPMTWNVEQAKKVVAHLNAAKDIKMQVGVQGMSE
jgi:predicted dehydrogenase